MQDEIFRELKRSLDDERLAILATVLNGPRAGAQLLLGPEGEIGGLGSETLEAPVRERVTDARADFRSALVSVEEDGSETKVFIEVHPPRPQLVIVGAVHVAIPLVTFARALGFRTIVVDPRATFATAERFPHADGVIVEWPQDALRNVRLHEGTYVALLSHDLRIDLPAFETVLRSPVRYIGALGSRKTHAKRVAALEELGFAGEEIDRIHAPIGLELGGRRAEEIAIAVMAEIVAVSHGIDPRIGTGTGS
jgi:xanthine dehydrogenase accessory factor